MTDDRTSPDHLYRPDEVAKRLGISLRTLERWRMTGQGPAFVTLAPGRLVRYSGAAIAAFLAPLGGRIAP